MADVAVKTKGFMGRTRNAEPGEHVNQPAVAGGANAMVEVIDPASDDIELDERVRRIVGRLDGLAMEQVSAKSAIEQRWLRAIRAYHGFYDPQVEKDLKEAKQSRAFVKTIRAKTVALEARLFDLIFPTDDKNWGIQPTPVPKLAQELKEAETRATNAAQQATDAEAAGNTEQAQQIVQEGNDQAQRAQAAVSAIAQVKKAAEAMQEEIDDQLVESQYPQESRKMIHDACQLGTGILKGPIVNQSARGKWTAVPMEGGGELFQLLPDENPRPKVKRVSPWNYFPDMSASDPEDSEFDFERYLWTRQDLRRMVKTHGFSPEAVRNLLRDDRRARPAVETGLANLMSLRSITEDNVGQIKGRYVGWEYHGPLECDEVCDLLRAIGKPDLAAEYEERNDPLDELRVIAFFCQGELLKISPEYPMDSGESVYSVFNVEESEGSIFGYGIPDIAGDTAAALNGVWRMGLDNAALSVGPQAIIDKSVMIPQDGDWVMAPKKIWLRIKAALPQEPDPIKFFNVPNNMSEISQIIKIALEFIDMETGIPMPQTGEQGSNTTKTVGGMAILQNASNIIFRRVVKNYDDGIITPVMRRMYDWNMQHNERQDIKGDMQVDARGTSVLLVKEVQAQNLMFVVTQMLANPTIATMLKPYENVKRLFQSMMISPDDVMETEDDWQKKAQQLAEQQAQQKDPATIQAESRIQAAEIAAKSRDVAGDIGLMIAQLKERTALLELAAQGDMSFKELQAALAMKQLDVESGERKMAVEIAAEEKFAQDARAHGEDPKGSGGYVSAGVTKKKSSET